MAQMAMSALLGATLAEWQRQREEEAARLAALRNSGGGGEEGDSDAADKKRMKVLARVNPAYARSLTQERNTRAAIAKVTAQELKGTNISVAQAQARQQAQWDANGQAIYAANQQFKETYGKEMDAANKEQAIKDATVNGVFNTGLYSVNLNAAQQKQQEAEAAEKAMQDYRMGEHNTVAIVQKGGGGKPLAAPASQTDDWLLSYEREAALEMYRIGEQNPNFTFDEVVATLALRKFRTNSLVYHFTGDNDTNCSNFLSHVWWQAGIRFPDSTWNIAKFNSQPSAAGNEVWFRTGAQQELFSNHQGEFRIVYSNVAGQPGVLRDQPSFNSILQNYPQIFKPGSAVFYYNSIYYNSDPEIDKFAWQHASILVTPHNQTNFFSPSFANFISRPALVEQDGLFDFNDLPRDIRSLDDTPNERLTQISIVPTQPIDPSLYNISPSELSSAILDGKSCYTVQAGGEGNFSLYYCPPTP